jgi:xylitol oxidase
MAEVSGTSTSLGPYPRLADFHALAARYDPAGVFRNPFLTRTIGR